MGKKMKLACSSTVAPGDTLTQKAEFLKECGYDGMSVFADYAHWSLQQHKEVLSLYERTGIVPCEFVFADPVYGHLMSEDPVLRNQCRQMYKEAAAVCAETGAITELEYACGPQDPLPLYSPYQKMPEKQQEEFIRVYREIASVTEGSAGLVLIEPINRYEAPYLNTVNDCAALLHAVNHPNAGLLLDSFHMSMEEQNLSKSTLFAEKWVRHVHLGDSNRLLPGYGHTDFAALISALNQIHYHGFLSLECAILGDPFTELKKASAFLAELIANDGQIM